MNNEEQKTTELEEITTTTISEVSDDEVTEESNGGFGKVFLGLAVAAGVGGLLWHKTKDKREQRAIEKLRKKGYEIIEPEDFLEVDDEIEAEYVESEEFEPEKDEKKK